MRSCEKMPDPHFLERLEATDLYCRLKFGMNRRLLGFFDEHVLRGGSDLYTAELACGSGYGTHLLASNQSVRLGVAADINTDLLTQHSPGEYAADFVVSDIFYPSFAPESFDLVWNSSSLEHFENPEEALRQMASLTKPNGHVFVGVPYLAGPLGLYFLTPRRSWREWLGRPYSLSALKGLFRKCDLQVEQQLVYSCRFFIGVLGRKVC